MEDWEEEVGDLLENYRLSHPDPQSPGALTTESRLYPQARSQRLTVETSLEKGKKRLVEEGPAQEQEQEQEGEKEDGGGRRYKKAKGDKFKADEEHEAQAGKRQKRTDVEESGWQGFGDELDSAAASTSAAPTLYKFADTGLPMRFKS